MEAALVLIPILAASALPLQTSAQPSCHKARTSLSPCYDYIYKSDSAPPPQCCDRLERMVQTQPLCLCEFLHGLAIGPIKNPILDLPHACNVQTPPASYCYSPPPSSGYSAKTLNSLMLSVLSSAGILIFM